jgi:hypothetical protein
MVPSKRDIIEVMARYALAADAKDYALMRSLFFDDATVAMQFDSEFLDGGSVSSFAALVEQSVSGGCR